MSGWLFQLTLEFVGDIDGHESFEYQAGLQA
jgi:hypothetical protein